MMTRREMMSGALLSPLLGSDKPASSRSNHPYRPIWPLMSGMVALDRVMGPINPGDLICIAGRPCSGKTTLLLQLALHVSERFRTHVLFVSLRESAAAIKQCRPPDDQARLLCRELDADVFYSAATTTPCVLVAHGGTDCVSNIAAVGKDLPERQDRGYGLVILDGWTTDPEADLPIASSALQNNTQPGPGEESRPALLWERHVRAAKRLATDLAVPVILGIHTASNPQMRRGPKPADLLGVREALKVFAAQTVWLHRPEIYLKGAARHHLRGIVRIVCERKYPRATRPLRSVMRYRQTDRRFT